MSDLDNLMTVTKETYRKRGVLDCITWLRGMVPPEVLLMAISHFDLHGPVAEPYTNHEETLDD